MRSHQKATENHTREKGYLPGELSKVVFDGIAFFLGKPRMEVLPSSPGPWKNCVPFVTEAVAMLVVNEQPLLLEALLRLFSCQSQNPTRTLFDVSEGELTVDGAWKSFYSIIDAIEFRDCGSRHKEALGGLAYVACT